MEERALATSSIPLRFCFMDNTCVALTAPVVQEFLDHLKGVEPSIQFIAEVESNGKLLFLDVLLQREPDGSISTTVYRKFTHTDRYLDFMSDHPLAHKLMVVRTLHSRAEATCSDVTAKIRRLGTSESPSCTTGIPEECFSTTGPETMRDPQTSSIKARWLPFPMCEVCLRQYTESSPHWGWRSPSAQTPLSGNYWWDQRTISP